MAPTFATHARSLLGHALSSDLSVRSPDGNYNDGSSLGPLTSRSLLLGRDDTDGPDPEAGIVHPSDMNNKFVFVLFGLIGAGLIIAGIWFFFWARNGGFFFKEDDWDDYKSTVLRRRGPNGTILSGATTETDLGGGSVYKDMYDGGNEDATTVVSGTTGITGGVSDVAGRERKRKRREQKEREKERRREERRRERDEKHHRGHSHSRGGDGEGGGRRKVDEHGNVVDEHAEAEAEEYLRNYRHEKAARVGGINRESDASEWDGSTNPTDSSRGGYTESSVTSELMGPIRDRDHSPAQSPEKPKKGGIRKVYSTADKRDIRETQRIRAEAKKLQERGRRAAASSSAAAGASSHQQRREFSWQRHNVVDEDSALVEAPPSYDAVEEQEADSRIPGSWVGSDVGSEVGGTKSYHHVIPGLSSNSGVGSSDAGTSAAGTDVRDYAADKRKKRRSGGGDRGYRRER